MTPMWRRIAKHVAQTYPDASRRDAIRDLIAVQRAFDLTPVLEMVNEVSDGLIEQTDEDRRAVYDLGERCTMPFDSFWIEFESYGGLLKRRSAEPRWVICNMATNAMGSRLHCERMGELIEVEPGCYLHEETEGSRADVRAGIAKRNQLDAAEPEVAAFARSTQRLFAAQMLAAIAVINSPRARQVDEGASKLLGSRLTLNGKRPEARWTKIVIGGLAGATRGADHHTTSPKAYHFVRAHNRQLSAGAVSRVRAHWRGDPAFGIRIGVYSVRGGVICPPMASEVVN